MFRYALACATMALAAPALAVVVPPGEQGFLTGTTVAARPDLAGTVLADLVQPYSITIVDLGRTASGTVQSRVVRTEAGTLDFYWRIVTDATSELDLFSLSVEAWAPGPVDTDYRTDGLGDVGPFRFINNSDICCAFDANWYFDPNMTPGQESLFFFARTDARAFALTSEWYVGVTGQDPSGGPIYAAFDDAPTFAPAAIPEPATWALLIAGFGLVGVAARRRHAVPDRVV